MEIRNRSPGFVKAYFFFIKDHPTKKIKDYKEALFYCIFISSGGTCALVVLFIFNRIYVANAGDCRACIYNPNEPVLFPMSFDFTPESDRQRIQLIAYQRPELLRHPITREKLYNRHVLSRKVKREEVGIKTVMYRDFYMAGEYKYLWSYKVI